MKRIEFASAFNFRDAGGYLGLDGRAVRHGRLYRSDALGRLGEIDRPLFESLGIRTVIDLRRPAEVESQGRVPEWSGFTWHNIAPDHPEWHPSEYHSDEGVARFLARRYLEIATQGVAGIVKVIGVIAEPQNSPVVVHCLAGKDRTGVVIAIVLSLLGVEPKEIAADYALTNDTAIRVLAYLRQEEPEAIAQAQPYSLHTPAEAMEIFLQELADRYGSIEAYLVGAGLTYDQIADLRDNLLEPTT